MIEILEIYNRNLRGKTEDFPGDISEVLFDASGHQIFNQKTPFARKFDTARVSDYPVKMHGLNVNFFGGWLGYFFCYHFSAESLKEKLLAAGLETNGSLSFWADFWIYTAGGNTWYNNTRTWVLPGELEMGYALVYEAVATGEAFDRNTEEPVESEFQEGDPFTFTRASGQTFAAFYQDEYGAGLTVNMFDKTAQVEGFSSAKLKHIFLFPFFTASGSSTPRDISEVPEWAHNTALGTGLSFQNPRLGVESEIGFIEMPEDTQAFFINVDARDNLG